MLTFSFETDLPLIGCGVDGETISRFSNHAAQPEFLPLVFTRRETEYIRKLADPALGFCAAFCCKEAVFKALGQMLRLRQCELLYVPEQQVQYPRLCFEERTVPEIGVSVVRFFQFQPDELVAVVHLFGRSRNG